MKLAVDTHHLLLENAGTRRVTINLLKQFKQNRGIDLLELRPEYSIKRGKSLFSKLTGHIKRFFWVHIQLPFICYQKRVDVLFSPEFNTPLFTTCKRAAIAHDANLRAQPQYVNSLWFYLYYVPFIEAAIRRADLIFTVSDFARQQVINLMRLKAVKVVVAYNGIDDRFLDYSVQQTSQNCLPEGLENHDYILFTGTFEARKNIERLIEAFARIKATDPRAANLKLAIAGIPASGKYSDRSKQITHLISRLGIQTEVVFCGYLPDECLPNVYRRAILIAFPSLHEGFGFPIIEGFASKVPVLTSNICSMPEVAGGAALLVDPYNLEDLTEKMHELLFDEHLRKRFIAEGNKRIKVFSWKSCADLIISHLRTLI